jgi:hypothetical protein
MGVERLSMRVNYIAHLHNELDLADENLARAVIEAVETEREACALVADDERGEGETAEEFDNGWNDAAMTIATAIRDRGGKNE